jgi:hypothetical protein
MGRIAGPGRTPDPLDRLHGALEQAERTAEASRQACARAAALRPLVHRAIEASRRRAARSPVRPAPAAVALTYPARVVAVGALVSVALEAEGASCPLHFLPADFRRLGAEPRLADRWTLTLRLALSGGAIVDVRLVALADR